MGNYNFEKDNKDYGETIRLGDINKEIQKLEEDAVSKNDNDNKENFSGGGKKPPKDSYRNKFFIACAVAAVLLIIIVTSAITLFLSRGASTNTNKDIIENAQDIFQSQSSTQDYVIKAFKDSIVYLYGIETGKIYSAETDEDTIITGVNGGSIAFDDLSLGDIVTVIKNEETGTAQQIRWAENAWKMEGEEDVRVDVSSSTISLKEEIFKYDKNTIFAYNGKEIEPDEISYADIVNITGVENNIYSVSIMKKHGYVYLKNHEEVDNLKIRVDFDVEQQLEEDMIVVPEGHHTIIVTGENIEDYMTEVDVTENRSAEIDLSLAEPKKTPVNLNVKPHGMYGIKVNDEEYPEGTKSLLLSEGKYTLEITKEGYEPYTTEIEVGKDQVKLDIELKKIEDTLQPPTDTNEAEKGNVTIYSDPGWAKVYVDGEYKGIAPIMVKLPYGEHYILLTMEGYEDCGEHITVNSAESTYKGSLK